MADIKKIKIGDAVYDVKDGRIISLTDNGSTTAGTWVAATGSPDQAITSYTDGQLFLYKVAVAGASTTTLNIDGVGAKTIYRSSTSKLTTQYGVGQYLLLAYNTTNDCFRVLNDYDGNTDKKTSSTNTNSKIFLIGATTQSSSGVTTYSHDTVYIDTDGHLYCNGKKVAHAGHTHEVSEHAAAEAHTVSVTGASYTPTGSVTVTPNTTTVNSITAVGSLPSLDYENSTIKSVTNFSAGTVPSRSSFTYATGAFSTSAQALTGVKASGTDTFLKSINAGSGSLAAYDAATAGNVTVANGTRIPVVTSVTLNGASASSTGKAAPHTHTHSVTVSGTTGKNSNSDTTATVLTGVTPSTTTVLTGVKVITQPTISLTANAATATGRIKYVESISGGSGSLIAYDAATNGTAKVSNGTRIPFITTASHTAASLGDPSTANVGSSGHTHTYTKPTGVSLGSNTTSSGGVKYIEDVTHSAASLTGTTTFNTDAIKSVTLSASDTSTDGPAYVTSISGNAPSLGGTKTFVTGVTAGSGSLSAYDSASGTTQTVANGTRIPFITSLFKNGYTPAGSVTLNNGTAPSMNFNTGTSTDTPYISSITGGSAVSKTTKYMKFSAGTTPVSSATFSGSAVTSGGASTTTTSSAGAGTASQSTGSATPTFTGIEVNTSEAYPDSDSALQTQYTVQGAGTDNVSTGSAIPTFTGSSVTSGAPSGTITVIKGYYQEGTLTLSTAEVASNIHTHNVTAKGSISSHTHTYTAPKDHTHYFGHTHAVIAEGTVGSHTHTYTKPAAHTHTLSHTHSVTAAGTISLTRGNAPSMNFNTGSSSDTPYISEVSGGSAVNATTKYMKFSAGTTPKSSASFSGTNSTAVVTGGTTYYLDHTHTSASSAGTGTVTLSGGSYSANKKYMKVTGTAASTGTVGISGGSISKTTKYFHPSITTETANTGTPSGTTSVVTGYPSFSGGSASHTKYYLAHGHTGASATTKYLSASASGTAVGGNGTAAVITSLTPTTVSLPSGDHTHTYGSSTALTTGNNSGSAVTAVTGVSGGSLNVTTNYLEHAHTGASSKSTASAVTGVAANGTATVPTALTTSTAYSITAVGSAPSLTTEDKELSTISEWSAGTLPTKGSNQTVVTSIKSSSFSGTAATITPTVAITGNSITTDGDDGDAE